jgi:hypothetical protein
MATLNITVTKTEYTLIAASNTKGIYNNHGSSVAEFFYDSSLPNVALHGHPIPTPLGDDFRLAPHPTLNLYAKVPEDAPNDTAVIVVTLGW